MNNDYNVDSNIQLIRHHQGRLNEYQEAIQYGLTTGNKKITKLQEKRKADFARDKTEQFMQVEKESKQAKRLSEFIKGAHHTLYCKVNEIQKYLMSYEETSTVGVDHVCGGGSSSDYSGDGGSRTEFILTLEAMMSDLTALSNSMVLDNYSITWSPADNSNDCCNVVYRENFHYTTPMNTCGTLPKEIGNQTTASHVEQNTNNFTSQKVPSCGSWSYQISHQNKCNDSKSKPTALNHNSVSNPDLGIRALLGLVMPSSTNECVGDAEAWWSYFVGLAHTFMENYATGNCDASATWETCSGDFEQFLLTEACLPSCFVDELMQKEPASDGSHNSVAQNAFAAADNTNSTSPAGNATAFSAGDDHSSAAPEDKTIAEGNGMVFKLKNHPTLYQIEDETDIAWLMCQINCLKKTILRARHQGEREYNSIQNTIENATKNIAYYNGVLNELIAVPDDSVMLKQLEIVENKKKLLTSLEAKYASYNPYFC